MTDSDHLYAQVFYNGGTATTPVYLNSVTSTLDDAAAELWESYGGAYGVRLFKSATAYASHAQPIYVMDHKGNGYPVHPTEASTMAADGVHR